MQICKWLNYEDKINNYRCLVFVRRVWEEERNSWEYVLDGVLANDISLYKRKKKK